MKINNPFLRKVGKKALIFWTKHGTKILKFGASAGVVGTAFAAAKASPEAKERLESLKEEYPDGIPPMVVVKEVAPVYIPTAVVGGLTVWSILTLDKMHVNQNAALTTLYSGAELALSEYKEKVKEKYGKEEAEEVRKEVIQKHVDDDPFSENNVLITGHGNQLFYDAFNGRYFWSSVEEVKKAETEINRLLALDGCATTDEFFEMLGLPQTHFGSKIGWMIYDNCDERVEVDYDYSSIKTGESCIFINFSYRFMPRLYNGQSL